MDEKKVEQIIGDAAQAVEAVADAENTTDRKIEAVADAAQDALGAVGVPVSDTDKKAAAAAASGIASAVTAKDGQPKYKSWLLWFSITALAVVCVRLIAGSDKADAVNNIATYALAALSALGIINNPNSKTSI